MLIRLKNLVADLGAPTAILYIVHRLCVASRLPLSLYMYRLVAQPVSTTPHLPPVRRAAFSCRRLEAGDPVFSEIPLDPGIVAARFEHGAFCYGLFRKEQVCAWLWVAFHAYEEDEVRCRFEMTEKIVWDFDVSVMPQHRLGFAFAALWDNVNAELERQGIDWSFSRISAFNMPSRRSHRRLGAIDRGGMVFLTFGPVQIMLQRSRPAFHIAFKRATRPIVRLDIPHDRSKCVGLDRSIG